ncbi:MAG: hypothetical protein Q4F95_14160 [Oscillospiraceae bacterium]|nr:hypothetical protein [Oscillospiraceae bacterium]
MNKKLIAAAAACSILVLTSCASKDNSGSEISGTDASSQTVQDTPAGSADGSSEAAGTDELQIDSKRYNTDYDTLKKVTDDLFKKYYDGIQNEDYDKCFGVFPDFYRKALARESVEYNQTDDEYIKQIHNDIVKDYGDDYYAYQEITGILQLYDDSLKSTEDTINKTFNTELTVEDAYSVYCKQVTRGKLKKDSSEEIMYLLLKIDGEYYLYDNYFESAQ